MKTNLFIKATPALLGLLSPGIGLADPIIEEIIVHADFRNADLMDIPASLSVVSSDTIASRNARHFDEILNAAPNVNFSAGASRGRYIQLRGIGERSQFVDPINPSVGVMIDDVDFSGIGNAGTLFDINQVEILRGPQGTRFGNNALAGLVYLKANAPTEEFEGAVEGSLANYDTWSAGAVLSGPLSQSLLGRIAVQEYQSDGFIDNEHLNREDTNDRDELTLRGKLRWLASEDLTLDLSLFHSDIDNGYDAFSLDNNRNTLSDEPGRDRQETTAVSIQSTWETDAGFVLESTLAFHDSDLEYGFDEDWAFTDLCEGTACDEDLWGFEWGYQSVDNYERDRDHLSFDLRLLSDESSRLFNDSTGWVVGFYFEDQEERLEERHTLGDVPLFTSVSEMQSLALYGELESQLSDDLTLKIGMRFEQFEHDYRDNIGINADPDEDLWGGQISLEYQLSDNSMVYALVSRGYKAGSVNGDALGKALLRSWPAGLVNFLTQRLEFDTETLLNFELGLKGSYFDDRLQTRLSLFRMDRSDMQLKAWVVDGTQFAGYIDNVEQGENYGLELETSWQVTENLQLFANLGWLETELEDTFFVDDVDLGLVDKEGREQAHAPNYQFNLGGQLEFAQGFYARLEVEGKDEFFFSNSHDAKSDSFELVNLTLGYRSENFDLALWSRNLLDKDYAVRGFRFGNDPRDFYTTHTYEQLGEPRVFGVTGKYRF